MAIARHADQNAAHHWRELELALTETLEVAQPSARATRRRTAALV
jgi:hypothetical protein